MLKTILLICSLSTPRAECTKETAASVTNIGMETSNYNCLSRGETVGAAIALFDAKVYAKIVCERVK